MDLGTMWAEARHVKNGQLKAIFQIRFDDFINVAGNAIDQHDIRPLDHIGQRFADTAANNSLDTHFNKRAAAVS